MLIKKISNKVTYRDLGGEMFIVDEGITETLTNDKVFEMGMLHNNWACYNFIQRRRDFKHDFPYKLYYGKVDGLGYIMAEDEFVENEPAAQEGV